MNEERVERLSPSALNAVQRGLYDSIVSGQRGQGPQYFPLTQADGSLNGPFGLMVHTPELGAPLQELGARIRYATTVPDRVREIAILTVARECSSSFEAFAHEAIGRAVGLSDAEITALQIGTFKSDRPAENCAAALCSSLAAQAHTSTDAFDAARFGLTAEQVLELVTLVGYYRLLAQLMNITGVGT